MTQARTESTATEDAAATALGSTGAVPARILKKRETDRRCQRMIRERTKAHIAYLEGLVEDFRSQDASGRVETLMTQLAEIKEERDTLAKQVKNIKGIVSGNSLLKEEPETQELSLARSRSEESEQPLSLSIDIQQAPNYNARLFDSLATSSPLDTPSYAVHNKEYQAYIESSSRPSWAASTLQPGPNTPYVSKYAAYNDDVPVRAIVEGWDAAEKDGHMHPAWRLLRGIDQIIFSSCEPRERLAIVTVMGLLLQAHLNPTTEQHKKLPAFYVRRPSQDLLHSYATEYFAWPGLRERFVFSEHRYCSNTFWRLFCSSLRVQWPYEFRDCYTRNVETGLYQVSPMFHERINDIRYWSMGRDFLERYPELYSDIPAWNHVPASIASTTHVQWRNRRALPRSHSAEDAASTHRSTDHRSSQPRSNEQLPNDDHAHQMHLTQSGFPHYAPSSANASFNSSTPTVPTYDFPPSMVANPMTEMHAIPPGHSWGYNGSLDMHPLNPP
ncbi:hypothetical protein LTR70_005501 [Exophiala xenobiotica]|uniref:Uncharacterized protein n=1 Tax=Lithohypha guttulata TaxID=1690604 RepID=A0ABR0KDW2_9EURO|nr:hypothetical protein LTR24_003868 [Lithohypha guttulata]KAK5318358.1 hypothetical protein LTR70_005501 [Exophiala xenobiotica]